MSTNPQILVSPSLKFTRSIPKCVGAETGSHLRFGPDAPRQMNGSGKASSREYNRDGAKLRNDSAVFSLQF